MQVAILVNFTVFTVVVKGLVGTNVEFTDLGSTLEILSGSD